MKINHFEQLLFGIASSIQLKRVINRLTYRDDEEKIS
jgi:hypothetical protein